MQLTQLRHLRRPKWVESHYPSPSNFGSTYNFEAFVIQCFNPKLRFNHSMVVEQVRDGTQSYIPMHPTILLFAKIAGAISCYFMGSKIGRWLGWNMMALVIFGKSTSTFSSGNVTRINWTRRTTVIPDFKAVTIGLLGIIKLTISTLNAL